MFFLTTIFDFFLFFHENLLDRTMSNPSALIIANKQQLNGRKLFLKHSTPEIFFKKSPCCQNIKSYWSISWNTFRPNLKKNSIKRIQIHFIWLRHFQIFSSKALKTGKKVKIYHKYLKILAHWVQHF